MNKLNHTCDTCEVYFESRKPAANFLISLRLVGKVSSLEYLRAVCSNHVKEYLSLGWIEITQDEYESYLEK